MTDENEKFDDKLVNNARVIDLNTGSLGYFQPAGDGQKPLFKPDESEPYEISYDNVGIIEPADPDRWDMFQVTVRSVEHLDRAKQRVEETAGFLVTGTSSVTDRVYFKHYVSLPEQRQDYYFKKAANLTKNTQADIVEKQNRAMKYGRSVSVLFDKYLIELDGLFSIRSELQEIDSSIEDVESGLAKIERDIQDLQQSKIIFENRFGKYSRTSEIIKESIETVTNEKRRKQSILSEQRKKRDACNSKIQDKVFVLDECREALISLVGEKGLAYIDSSNDDYKETIAVSKTETQQTDPSGLFDF